MQPEQLQVEHVVHGAHVVHVACEDRGVHVGQDGAAQFGNRFLGMAGVAQDGFHCHGGCHSCGVVVVVGGDAALCQKQGQ